MQTKTDEYVSLYAQPQIDQSNAGLRLFTVRNVVAVRLCFHRRLSFCSRGGGMYHSVHWADTHLVRPPPGRQTPPSNACWDRLPPAATAADSTHPIGMHSCHRMYLTIDYYFQCVLCLCVLDHSAIVQNSSDIYRSGSVN